MGTEEKVVKQLFKEYKKMTCNLQHGLEEIGVRAEHGKRYIKFFYNDKLFIYSCLGNDY